MPFRYEINSDWAVNAIWIAMLLVTNPIWGGVRRFDGLLHKMLNHLRVHCIIQPHDGKALSKYKNIQWNDLYNHRKYITFLFIFTFLCLLWVQKSINTGIGETINVISTFLTYDHMRPQSYRIFLVPYASFDNYSEISHVQFVQFFRQLSPSVTKKEIITTCIICN